MGYAVILGNAPAGAVLADATVQGIINFLRPLLSLGTTPDGANDGLLLQAELPAPADQGKIWFRLTSDSNGIALGQYFYLNGLWCPIYRQQIGFCTFFIPSGDPQQFFNMTTGRGLLAGSTPGVANDWYGWRLLLNNASQTPAGPANRFPVIASGYDSSKGGFYATIDASTQGAQGGNTTGTTLTPANIPSLNIAPGLQGYQMVVSPSSGGNQANSQIIVDNRYVGSPVTPATVPTPTYTNPNANAVPTPLAPMYPPFQALALAQFIGYTYTDPTTP